MGQKCGTRTRTVWGQVESGGLALLCPWMSRGGIQGLSAGSMLLGPGSWDITQLQSERGPRWLGPEQLYIGVTW